MHKEEIQHDGKTLVWLVRKGTHPSSTCFLTPETARLQVGFVVYPAGGEVERHVHHPIERQIVGTSEVILIHQGTCEMDVYTDERELLRTVSLGEGDIVITNSGGHGFRMTEDTVLLEVKQGPYVGQQEKERF